MNPRLCLLSVLSLAAVLPALAQQRPSGPYTPTVEERAQLDQKKAALAERVKTLGAEAAPDAAVFLHTAELADRLALYTNRGQVATVLRGLDLGLQRAELAPAARNAWMRQPGKSLRGFRSRIDGSIQPYGLILPAGYDPSRRYPLHVFLHGRGVTEVSFLQQMEPVPGSNQAKAPDVPFIELHPFGRGNNGWRWSGETDVFEALAQVTTRYAVDPDRVVLRGFSMGGHGSWHIGVHYPHRWSAVSPGAGFSDTRRYQKIAPGAVPEYQEKAWHLYDAVDYALNLFNTPFVGYGGDKDPQLQAALNMKEAAAQEGLDLKVVVGPDTEHRYHPESLKEIMRFVQEPVRNPSPPEVRFTTWTLKYNRCAWVTLEGLERHYERARVVAKINGAEVEAKTTNVSALRLDPLPDSVTTISLDGQKLKAVPGRTLFKRAKGWSYRPPQKRAGRLAKRHNLQGPIDDAFMERFLVVRPTGQAWNPATDAYSTETIRRFGEEWRFGFRGEAPVKDDSAVTEQDWKAGNLVLFGDPASNRLIARIVEQLPLKWTRQGLEVNGRKYGPEAIPVLIYPNPLNPERYVVINSGHTWTRRELDASNAQLFPRLPDWAVLKLGDQAPEVLAADYFDEAWKFRTRG